MYRLRIIPWMAALCVLIGVCVAPAFSRAQATIDDQTTTESGTKKKSKSKKAKRDTTAADEQTASSETKTSTTRKSRSRKSDSAAKPAATGAASDSEIAAAKSSGKVWVNLDSGIYHKSGRFYGKTKNGKFMTEAEARAAGYKSSKKD
jgi:hypothetical protein